MSSEDSASSSAMPSGSSGKDPHLLVRRWALFVTVLGVLVAILVFMLGTGVLRGGRYETPRFTVSAINTLCEECMVYETTNHLTESDPADAMTLTWGLQVIPHYNGDRQYGRVDVLVKNPRGEVVHRDTWASFCRDSESLVVDLDPYELSREVDRIWAYRENIFEADGFEPPEAVFTVEIATATGRTFPVDKPELIVRNVPFCLYTAVSDWYEDGDAVDVFVCGKNLGGPSDFYVVGYVFEVTDIGGGPWHAQYPWPCVDYQESLTTGVDSGEGFTATLTFPDAPDFAFEAGKTYVVTTLLIKKQNYVDFSDSSWDSAPCKWKFGGIHTTHLLQW